VGVDPLLEAEVRGGAVEYQRIRLRAGRSATFGIIRAAALTELAASSPGTPFDVRPAASRDIAPWLPVGALLSRHQAVLGLDAAVPAVLNGYLRVRLRALATGDDLPAFDESDTWRLGGEIGAIWPTVLGPVSVGAAAGQRARWRFNISVGTPL
jgi:hypothetical protein